MQGRASLPPCAPIHLQCQNVVPAKDEWNVADAWAKPVIRLELGFFPKVKLEAIVGYLFICSTFGAVLMGWEEAEFFFFLSFFCCMKHAFLGKCHLANFLPLCNTWSALMLPCSLLPHTVITKIFCLCLSALVLPCSLLWHTVIAKIFCLCLMTLHLLQRGRWCWGGCGA